MPPRRMAASRVVGRRRTDTSADRRPVVKLSFASPPKEGRVCSYVDEVAVEFVDEVWQVEHLANTDAAVHRDESLQIVGRPT